MSRSPRPGSHKHAAPPTLAQARRLSQQRPHDPRVWKDLGDLQLHSHPEQALASFEQALRLSPDEPQALERVAKAAQKLGHADRALELVHRALRINPDFAVGHHRLATLYFEQGQFANALPSIERALALMPNDCRMLSRKGLILNRLERHGEAIAVFDKLIEREPGDYSHWNNAANLYKDIGQLAKADKYYQKAVSLARRKDVLPYSNRLTSLHYDPDRSRDYIFEVCKEWQSRFGPKSVPARPDVQDRALNRCLRIGLVSDGLRQHPVGNMIVGVLEKLPRHQFELFAYSTSQASDHLTLRIQATVHQWLAIKHMDEHTLAQRIRDDRIDILIDLCGHNAGNRMGAMALQPAPLLVKWVGGLINTTGLDAIDYLLSDSIESPEGEDAFYTEKLIRLPDDYICYDPPPYTPDIKPLPALESGFITYGCFNNPTKVNDVLLLQWAELMRATPDSRLLLKGGAFGNSELREHVQAVMAAQGVAPERVLVEGPVGHKSLLETYNRVDIALDTWPYSGGLTTCEALLMGVPVVTLPGPTFAGRHSATHLVNAGLPELVVDSWDEYRQRVIGLTRDLNSLSRIRGHLRDVLMRSPVCDSQRFASHFSTAMRAIWQRYCEGKPTAALTLSKDGGARFQGEAEAVDIQHPVEPVREEGFSFKFQGKIVTLDHGATLVASAQFVALQKLGAFSTIAFDPASRIDNAKQLAQLGELHYYPHAALGNGQATTLYACLDPMMTATLEPLAAQRPGARVLAQLALPTLKLDAINGLSSVDWLVLDNLNDSLAVIDHGQRTLSDTLLVQARVNFAPTHRQQPDVGLISQSLARLGFSFYRLNKLQHDSHRLQGESPDQLQASHLVCADALFLPDSARLATLSDNQRLKLAFILHTVYGAHDVATQLLSALDSGLAERYLKHCQNTSSASMPTSNQVEALAARQDDGLRAPMQEPQVTFPEEVAAYLKTIYAEASVILEYGSGGSTIMAARMPDKSVISVENDARWAKDMQAWIASASLPSPPVIYPIDVGETGPWARPKNARAWKKFHTYPLKVWDEPFFEQPDVILIDGRFRIACFVTAYLRATKPMIVLFDDYLDRPHYHVVERLLAPTRFVGRMARFDLRPLAEIPRSELTWLVASYNEVAYAQ
ncbi:O-linked N-acetylglucosamine transferase, SPINDLY family protein [Pseudomonas mohnii]|uniref:O-linked N-acetylglucosamine transferase, SPINDLY family protein n=1 Tax=Pseudomonas mohnii TaxID=395600 RepID=UPI0018C55CB3|nr:tetratricopeptide repeat protein [Pseudomonas mohnii]MBH8610374.1 tetratricopeptide repeat protein [Pseudomonas mohnii]